MFFKNVEKATTRHGKELFYYRRRRDRRYPLLGAPGSPEFEQSYREAVEASAEHDAYTLAQVISDEEKNRIRATLRARLKNARSRDRKRGRASTLTDDWVDKQLEDQNFRCAVTGLPFRLSLAKTRVNPFSPSLDRLDCSKGYETGNVRIVLFAVNMMMLDWGDDVFHVVAKAYVARSKIPNPPQTGSEITGK